MNGLTQGGYQVLMARLLVAQSAQPEGDRLLGLFAEQFKANHTYSPLVFSREPKTRERCEEKVGEYRDKDPSLTERDAINMLKDLAGGRVVVPFGSEREIAHTSFCQFVEQTGPAVCRLDGDKDPKKESSGYRALHQGILIRLRDGSDFPFEVQFMSAFQHVWATAHGPLFRYRKLFPRRLHNRMRQLGSQLDALSERLDQLREGIRRYEHRRRP